MKLSEEKKQEIYKILQDYQNSELNYRSMSSLDISLFNVYNKIIKSLVGLKFKVGDFIKVNYSYFRIAQTGINEIILFQCSSTGSLMSYNRWNNPIKIEKNTSDINEDEIRTCLGTLKNEKITKIL